MLAECEEPPEADLVAWSITDSLIEDELVSGTNITYVCEPMHEFEWGETSVLMCGNDGKWSESAAPKCAPGQCNFV